MVNLSPDYLFFLDAEGKVLFMNKAALKVHGIRTLEDIKGSPFTKLAPPSCNWPLQRLLGEVRQGKTVSYYYEAKTKDGPRTFESILTPIKDASGDVANFMVDARDITNRDDKSDEGDRANDEFTDDREMPSESIWRKKSC